MTYYPDVSKKFYKKFKQENTFLQIKLSKAQKERLMQHCAQNDTCATALIKSKLSQIIDKDA